MITTTRLVPRHFQALPGSTKPQRVAAGWLALVACWIPGVAVSATDHGSPSRPNIICILADDLGSGDLSCLNPTSAWQTPRLDRLASEGLVCTDAHSTSSVCTPSRYALLTGRYSWRGPLKKGVLDGYKPPLIEPGRLTVAELLRQHGYTTAAFGKWHLGVGWSRSGPRPEDVDFTSPFHGGPLAHGFDRFLGIATSLDMPPYVWLSQDRAASVPTAHVQDSRAPRLWRAGPISDDFKMEAVQTRLVDEAAAYVEQRAQARDGRPFFLYLPLAAPHTPLLPTAAFEGSTRTTLYGDFVAQVDSDIGRLLDALDRTGLADDTLVIVTADNGFAPAAGLAELEPFHHDPSGGRRGYKSDLFEGGHRVPFIVRWPGHVPAGSRTGALVSQADLLATCADLVGATLPEDAGEDSISLLPLLGLEAPAASVRDSVIHHSGEGRFAIRQGRWKLLAWPGSGGWSAPTPHPSEWLDVPAEDLSTLPPFQLYDLEADPAERTNLAAKHPDMVARLGKLLRAHVDAGRSTPGKPQPVELSGWPQVEWRTDFSSPPNEPSHRATDAE
jgi:arylsulfatase A-like enzyme